MASRSIMLCKSTRAATSVSSRCCPSANSLTTCKSSLIPEAPYGASKVIGGSKNQNICMLEQEFPSRLRLGVRRAPESVNFRPKLHRFTSSGALRGDYESDSFSAFVSRSGHRSVSTQGGSSGASVASLQYNERVASTPGAKYFATDKRPIVLFDGVCNFCNGGVNFMLDNDPEGKLRFAALQSEPGRALLQRAGRAPEDISSIVLIEPNRSYTYSEAILRIAQYLEGPFGVLGNLGLLAPGLVRDTFYKLVAQNRYNILGKKDECRLGDERFDDRFLKS